MTGLPAHAQQPLALDRTLATLHGVVRNAATGEGVPRALVEIEGDANTGVLTDGDGRFEIPGVPVGPQAVRVHKPGFLDESPEAGTTGGDGRGNVPHTVLLAADMPDVVFTLTPACAIRGRIDLSTGDSAAGMEVGLLQRMVMDGRAIWQSSGFTRTLSDGTYRFGGLADGQYKVYTNPAFDSEPAVALVVPGKGGAAERWGYASIFYPDARDPSGAAPISVANGEQAQANLTLTREPFQTVTASVMLPRAMTMAGATAYSAQVLDGNGHELPYTAQYDANAHSLQVALPEGSYSLLVSTNPGSIQMADGPLLSSRSVLVGTADFSVAGRAITGLRVPLSAPQPNPVQVSIVHSGAATEPAENERVSILLSQAGEWAGGAVMGQYANGPIPGPLAASYMAPGAYWVHTFLTGSGELCESSFTAGGASLGREPVTIGISGATAPMELTLRDDCAQLALQLPGNLASVAPGEESFYTVYVVPDFDFTGDLHPAILRPSEPGIRVLDGLTPGNYHVYTFKGSVALEYRNPAALAALPNPGQAVTLSPGARSDLVVELPAQ